MGSHIAEELTRLKGVLEQRQADISSIGELIKEEIDRDFPLDPWELSPIELEGQMGQRLSLLNDDIDTRPDPGSITSHRRFVGKIIVRVKRLMMKIAAPYTNILLDKQRRFNEQVVAFQLASFIRFSHLDKRLKKLEEQLADLQDQEQLLADRVARLIDGHRDGETRPQGE